MADYSGSKGGLGSVFPDNATESSNVQTEPLLTPSLLKQRFLFGLPLFSQIKDPVTGKVQQITDPILNDIINGCVSQIETEFKIDILPVKRFQKLPFFREEYDAWGFFKLDHTPVYSLDKLTISPSNGIDVYEIPKDWIETANLIQGQFNIVPIGIGSVYQGLIGSTPANGAWFLSALQFTTFLPAYWGIQYTAGYPDGKLPRVINEMVGCLAAIEVLGLLGATHAKSTSTSLSVDSFSQSVGTLGPNLYGPRIQQLTEKYQKLGNRLRALYNQKIFASSI